MNKFYLLPMAASMLFAMSSCIDDAYDLSDIDTTARLKVDNLTIPVNIDEISLHSIINLDEDGILKIVRASDGKEYYAIVKEGDILSDNIRINPFYIEHPVIEPAVINLNISGLLNKSTRSGVAIDIKSPAIPFSLVTTPITTDITDLTMLEGDMQMGVTFTLPDLKLDDSRMPVLRNLKVQLLKGLTADGNYDSAKGLLTIDELKAKNGKYTIMVKATKMTLPKGAFIKDQHIVKVDGEMQILDGVVDIDPSALGNITQLPKELKLVAAYEISDIEINKIDGMVHYDIQNVEVSPVHLDDLPSVLSQDENNVVLIDPQIYIKVSNPFYANSIYAVADMALTATHRQNGTLTFTPDKNPVQLGYRDDREIEYLISPTEHPKIADTSYGNTRWIPFTTLGQVLSSPAGMSPDGLPALLDVKIDNPHVPDVQVENFELGDKGRLTGNFTLFAPLQFGEQTEIMYTDTVDGWASDTLDKVHVTRLVVSATVNSEVPIALDFSGYPIDIEGNRIEGVTITGATIPAMASGYQLIITVEGEFSGLDGLRFTARAASAKDAPVLSPDMKISLTNIRPCVSGYYDDEL